MLSKKNNELQLTYDLSLAEAAKEKRHNAVITERAVNFEAACGEILRALRLARNC